MKEKNTIMLSKRVPKSLVKDMKELSEKYGTNWTHELVSALQQRVERIKAIQQHATARSPQSFNAQ